MPIFYFKIKLCLFQVRILYLKFHLCQYSFKRKAFENLKTCLMLLHIFFKYTTPYESEFNLRSQGMRITKKNHKHLHSCLHPQVKGRGKKLEKQFHLTLDFVQIWILEPISEYSI